VLLLIQTKFGNQQINPKAGPIFAKRQASNASYRKAARDKEKLNTTVYTNELHDSLMGKDGPSFWECWR